MIPFQVGEHFFKVGDKIIGSLRLDDHIVSVSFDVAANLLIEEHLDSPLISCPGVLESEGHGGVAVRTEGRDERRLDLVFLLGRSGDSRSNSQGRRLDQDIIHHALRCVLLHHHVLRTQERWGDLSKGYPDVPRSIDRPQR